MTNLDTPFNCLCAGLRRAARIASRQYDQALAPIGINVQQFTALVTLNELGPTTVTQLAQSLELERTAATRNLAVMEKAGLIKRREGEDRRERVVEITAEGRKRLNNARPMWRNAQRDLIDKMGEPIADSLLQKLDSIA
uniref:MarR family winged helix-turn-helix transcriptional regulator n=1 Tax=uncultured Altererythrobacter sp. TaxID=500840 RepID=UPI0026300C24|nr:MarR family winged helix-turn-helix transcriptional regulator [uncultured Altererythrobacter sp.]